MEEIKFLYGFVRRNSETSNDGFIKIMRVDFKSANTEKEEEIKNLFSNKLEVYSGIIFKTPNLKEGDFVRIRYKEHSKDQESIRNDKIIHDKVDVLNRIYDISYLELENDFLNVESNSLNEIRENAKEINSDFYLTDLSFIYGPLKIIAGKIQPKESKQINKYELSTDDYYFNPDTEIKYLIKVPSLKLATIDCMSPKQLLDYLKTLLNPSTTRNSEDINRLRDLFTKINIEDDQLQKNRIQRIQSIIGNIQYTAEEVYKISQEEKTWTNVFNKIYNDNLEKFKDYHWQELKHQKEIEDEKISNLMRENQKLLNKKTDLEVIVNNLESKKNEIIENIRLQTMIQAPLAVNSGADDVTFYDKISKRVDQALDHSLTEYFSSIKHIDDEEIEFTFNFLRTLEKSKICKVDDLELFINRINIFGSFDLYIQNAEIDWIKYESLYKNGIKQIVQSSINNPDIPHFYVLNNYNIASFEIYAMPLIELLNKQRKHFPGTNHVFPNNLKIILLECVHIQDTFSSEVLSIEGQIQIINLKEFKTLRNGLENHLTKAIKFKDIQHAQ